MCCLHIDSCSQKRWNFTQQQKEENTYCEKRVKGGMTEENMLLAEHSLVNIMQQQLLPWCHDEVMAYIHALHTHKNTHQTAIIYVKL